MGEPVTWAAVGMAAVSNMGLWLYIWRGNRGKKDDDGNRGGSRKSNPGYGTICIERGKDLTRIMTKQERYDEDVREIKADIKEIKKAVAVR